MGQLFEHKLEFFGRRYPAWVLVAVILVAGAGAATGIVLADSIIGTSTVTVSQAVLVAAPPIIGGDADESLGTVEDNGARFGAHFEANNGDLVTIYIPLKNEAGPEQDIVVLFTLGQAPGLTISIVADGVGVHEDVVRTGPTTWVFTLDGIANGDPHGITLTVALEDSQTPGFYELNGAFKPMVV